MKSNWREVLSWDVKFRNTPNHMEGHRKLIDALTKRGIKFTPAINPQHPGNAREGLLITPNIFVTYEEYNGTYRLYTKKWRLSDESSGLEHFVDDYLMSELENEPQL